MTEHKRILTGAIYRLYNRINGPTAIDARTRDIALRALDELEPPEAPFDYNALNANQVREAVEEGKLSKADALLKEKAGKNRKALVAWLEEDNGG